MKKVIITLALISLMLPLVAFTGTVLETNGKVEIETDTGWKPLQKGDTVDTGRVISTGFRSSAIIQVAGSNVSVSQLTRLSLDQLTETNDAHESEIFLDLGSIAADVSSVGNKRVGFVVNTPVATASVRGTSFKIGIDTLSVSSGLVAYSGVSSIDMPVSKGNSALITPSGRVSKPVETKIATRLGQTATTEPIQSLVTSAESVVGEKDTKVEEKAQLGIIIR